MPKTVTVNIVAGEPRLGLWCDRCLTSAAYEIDCWAFGVGWPQIISVIRRCDRCED